VWRSQGVARLRERRLIHINTDCNHTYIILPKLGVTATTSMETSMTSLAKHQQPSADLVLDSELIRRYDHSGPRYTSYPTADRFVEAYTAETHTQSLGQRPLRDGNAPMSLYVHLPFCDTICFYCGCNKITTRDHGRSAKYLRYLGREAALTASKMSGSRRVEQLHLGGGTPTFLSSEELTDLMQMLSQHFELAGGEYSIEIDPRTADAEKMATLAKLGFNRISVGVQDFDPAVQKAVNRIQSEEQTVAVIDAARRNGMTSVNIDLIYGLPKQHVIGFSHTLDRVISLKPDRIALYSYAHLPTVFKPQRRILSADLPTAEAKLQIMLLAIRRLTDAGYVYIGMDHFALPHDSLAQAARKGLLHRNFQGYSTQPDCDLVALGISSISKVGPSYSQNVRTLDEYYDCLDRGELPTLRGIELTADDLLRRSVIQSLMCQFELSIAAIEEAYLIEFKQYFRPEIAALEVLRKDGLIDWDGDWITVTPRGRIMVRAVAMIFDRHLQHDRQRATFSKLI
jgi:oxygen-independent coproporphyrinogen-3 oxidase